ncbi:MAG: HU family DNA-binding protein [Planctomycetales bacterium]|nr:HU family DNA-binding protein [Planctomycetales bacterium]
MAKTPAKKAPTKTEVYGAIAEETGLSKKEVAAVVDSLNARVKKGLSSKGPGVFSIPGLVKITKKQVPARKATPNWKNPFTGNIETRPAKPASVKVAVRALKALKDMV